MLSLVLRPAVLCSSATILKSFSRSLHVTRTHFSKTIQRTKAPLEAKLRIKDKIHEAFQLIYRAPLENYLRAANLATTLSAVGIGGIIIYNWCTGNVLSKPATFGERVELVADEGDLLMFALGFVALCVTIQIMVHRYPLRIYKNRSKYIAVFDGQLPMTTRQISFGRGEVKEVPPTGILPWRYSRYNINSSKVLLMIDYFKSPSELTTMMTKKKE